MKFYFFILVLLMSSTWVYGNINKKKMPVKPNIIIKEVDHPLLKKYKKQYKDKKSLVSLKKETLKLGTKAVPILTDVMKSGKFPEKNRWIATFLLGKIMGVKSAPFLVKFLDHPSWVMRMASLKTLLALKQDKYKDKFVELLKDKSFIVRVQALNNIRKLKIKSVASNVWEMLYDKSNYYTNKKSKGLKRTNIIKNIITTVGDLEFKLAAKPLSKMINNNKYKDIFSQIEYSLEKITGKKAPKGNIQSKRIFWNRLSASSKKI